MHAFRIVLQAWDLLRSMPSLVDVHVPHGCHFTVCGDVHGQYFDLLNIFELNGLPSEENPYLFNGDFVDRGSFSFGSHTYTSCIQVPHPAGLMWEILWSDHRPQLGRGPSKRGVGLSCGADVTKMFLKENNLNLVVRSHEVKDEGQEIEHDGKLMTVFSAPNYCDLPHPDVKPMACANNFHRLFQ